MRGYTMAGSSLGCKYYTLMEGTDNDKRSSLLLQGISFSKMLDITVFLVVIQKNS
jgi:hypothetical protein